MRIEVNVFVKYVPLFYFNAGMYDATPGNYWFGKKWYWYWNGGRATPKCPDDLTSKDGGGGGGGRFINQNSDVDPPLLIQCL